MALVKRELLAGRAPLTHGGAEVRALDGALGRRAGELLGVTGEVDGIDAAVALLALDGDMILTSDLGDLTALVAATGTHADIVPV